MPNGILASKIKWVESWAEKNHPNKTCKVYQLIWSNGAPVIDKIDGREWFSCDLDGYSSTKPENKRYV
jgi:hypothetical protein